MSKKHSIIFLSILFSLLFFITSTVYAGTISVTRYEQERTNWCWVAVAKMMGKSVSGTTYTQSQICQKIKGSVTNSGCNSAEQYSAIKYTTGKSVAMYSQISYAQFNQEIDSQNTPVAIGMIWSSGGKHSLVVGGCGYGGQTLRLIDPAPNCGTAWYNYTSLCNGTTIQSGTGYYTETWYIN